jgi:Shikimate kinase
MMEFAIVAPIFLIGYRGTGKSTVARHLAERLGYDSVDADAEIERRAGKSIAAIFAEDGEAIFRDLESQLVVELWASAHGRRAGRRSLAARIESQCDPGGWPGRVAHGACRRHCRAASGGSGDGRPSAQPYENRRPGRGRSPAGRADADLPPMCYACREYRRKNMRPSGR